METLNISESNEYPLNKLKLDIPNSFKFCGKTCCSLASVFYAMTFEELRDQQLVCSSPAQIAKFKARDNDWKSSQKLHWNGVTYDRNSEEYQSFLDDLINAAVANMTFLSSLNATGDVELTYAELGNDPTQTPITSDEYCSRLMEIRDNLV